MRICVVGAGALGTYFSWRLRQNGHQVALFGRGAHFEALVTRGVVSRGDGGMHRAPPFAAVSATAGADFDAVLLTLKSHQVPAIAARLARLVGDTALLITPQNGVPWWLFQSVEGQFSNRQVHAVDPKGSLLQSFAADRIIGMVVNKGVNLMEPGAIFHDEVPNNSFVFGGASAAAHAKAESIAQAFSGHEPVRVSADIRAEKLTKLLLNLAFNPLTALTRATIGDAAQHPQGGALALRLMEEALATLRSAGFAMQTDPKARLARAREIGPLKTSMLRDVELGKPLEIDAIAGALVEIAGWTSTPVPTIQVIFEATKLLDATLKP